MMIEITCRQCGNVFQYDYRQGQKRAYCSERCYRLHKSAQERARGTGPYGSTGVTWSKRKLMPDALIAYDYKCAMCGWSEPRIQPSSRNRGWKTCGLELHHIEPVAKGGVATWDNVILICPNCHRMADGGVYSKDELKANIRPRPTPEQMADHVERANAAKKHAAQVMAEVFSPQQLQTGTGS